MGHCAALNLWMPSLQDARVIDWQQQILIVSPFFYPELISTGKANQHLAEAFVAEGHGVTVVCSHPLYPAWDAGAQQRANSGDDSCARAAPVFAIPRRCRCGD